MISLTELKWRILKKVNPEIPIFIETDRNHIQGSIHICEKTEFNKYNVIRGWFIRDRNRENNSVALLAETDETKELFSEKSWKGFYKSQLEYARNWVLNKFPILIHNSNNDFSAGIFPKDKLNYNAFVEIVPSITTVRDILSLAEKNLLQLGILLFPYTDEYKEITFYFTHINGIGINRKSFIYSGREIKSGEAVIINLNRTVENSGNDEICDFSLYRPLAQNSWPKKPSPNLFHSLISERRKTYEK